MTKERIYHLLHHFYNLLINDFPRNGLITKGIYEVEHQIRFNKDEVLVLDDLKQEIASK